MNSFSKIVNAFHCAALEANLPARSDTQIRHTVGLGLHAAFAQLYPAMDWQQLDNAVMLYRKYWLADEQTQSAFYPGVTSGLGQLQEAGYLLAVATGKSRSGLNKMFEQHHLDTIFTYSRCADETQQKPHPQMLLDLLLFSGLDATQCVMVGDTTFDIEMANNANIDAIGVSYGSHTVNMLNQYRLKYIVDNFEQLVAQFI